MLVALTNDLRAGRNLSEEQSQAAVQGLVDPGIAVEAKADFLTAFATKGETNEEIATFATELRKHSVPVPVDPITRNTEILDVCGTGGDQLNTFNISTTVAIIAASAGVTVAKHGNRAITSQSGSADVLEVLGVKVDLTPEEAAKSLKERRFAFFFAPKYHPAFAHIAPARKLCASKGQRTIFNFLGPLLNPARPSAQLVGVPQPKLTDKLARVLQILKVRRAMVVSGSIENGTNSSKYFDELSTMGRSTIAEFYQDRGFHTSVLDSADFPISRHTLADLTGGDKHANAEITLAILEGNERGPKREAVVLNTAAALFVAGVSESLVQGWQKAEELIDGGKGLAKLRELQR